MMNSTKQIFNPIQIYTAIRGYGFEISIIKYVSQLLGMSCIMYLFGRYLGLVGGYLWGLVFIITMIFPVMIHNLFLAKYEESRFMDIGNYIEQLLYSFKRHSKITSALEDTIEIFPEGNMGLVIEQALAHIQGLATRGNVYQEALGMIEQSYNCEIIRRVHKFIISVEVLGGDHKEAVNLLIEDRNKWVNRTLEAQKGKNQLRRNMTLAVVFSVGIIASTIFMIPEQFTQIRTTHLAQLTTLVILVINYFLWIFVQCKLSGSFIENKGGLSEELIDRYYIKVKKVTENKIKQKSFMIGILLAVIFGVVFKVGVTVVLSIGVLIIVVITNNSRQYKLAVKKLKREVEKHFPEWILGVSLRLQREDRKSVV